MPSHGFNHHTQQILIKFNKLLLTFRIPFDAGLNIRINDCIESFKNYRKESCYHKLKNLCTQNFAECTSESSKFCEVIAKMFVYLLKSQKKYRYFAFCIKRITLTISFLKCISVCANLISKCYGILPQTIPFNLQK